MKKILAIICAAAMAVTATAALSGCGNSGTSSKTDSSATEAKQDDASKAEDYDIHLEADISALENTLGYELGSWVPYLTVDYKVAEGDEVKAEGIFMEMAASDGPHYGANIKLPDAGTYELTITDSVASPVRQVAESEGTILDKTRRQVQP